MIFSAPVTVAWSGVECNFLSSKWEGSHVKPEWHYIRSKHISIWKENIWCLYQHIYDPNHSVWDISQIGWFGSYVSLMCQWLFIRMRFWKIHLMKHMTMSMMIFKTEPYKSNLIRRFSCVLCLVLNSAVLLKGIRREFAGEGEVRFNLDRSASSSSCPPLCVLSSSRRCGSRCSRSRRSTSTTSTPPPTLHIEEKQRRGSHSAGQGRGGLRLGGDWNCKVKQYWQPLIRATMKIMNHFKVLD